MIALIQQGTVHTCVHACMAMETMAQSMTMCLAVYQEDHSNCSLLGGKAASAVLQEAYTLMNTHEKH